MTAMKRMGALGLFALAGLNGAAVTLTYDVQGIGATPAERDVDAGGVYGEQPVPEGAAGYEFGGWWATWAGRMVPVLPGLPLLYDSDHTLVALWNAVTEPGTVDARLTYDLQGHGVAPEPYEVGDSSTYGELPEPKADAGQAFDGWWVRKGGFLCRAESGARVFLPDDCTLIAQWSAKPTDVSAVDTRIEFDVQSVGAPLVEKLELGDATTFGDLPVPAAPAGQKFDGWWGRKFGHELRAESNGAVVRPDDCILRAKWDAETVEVVVIVTGDAEPSEPEFDPETMTKVTVGDGLTVVISNAWFAAHRLFGDDLAVLAKGASPGTDGRGKLGANGKAVAVWEDYVAGTNPNDSDDLLTVEIEMVDGRPRVNWRPALNGVDANGGCIQKGVRNYRIWGRSSLSDGGWQDIDQKPGSYRFFKVSVEMR